MWMVDYRTGWDRLNEGIQIDQLFFEPARVQCQFTVLVVGNDQFWIG